MFFRYHFQCTYKTGEFVSNNEHLSEVTLAETFTLYELIQTQFWVLALESLIPRSINSEGMRKRLQFAQWFKSVEKKERSSHKRLFS
jgi:hypothetical protein